MWAYEPFVGDHVLLRRKADRQFRDDGLLGAPREKKDTDVKVGQLLTLQGGLGKSYLGGGLILGAAYYAQWKLTADDLAAFVLPGGDAIDLDARNKHKVFAFGPDVTLPVASTSNSSRWSTSAISGKPARELKTEGETLVVTATFPVPSVRLK